MNYLTQEQSCINYSECSEINSQIPRLAISLGFWDFFKSSDSVTEQCVKKVNLRTADVIASGMFCATYSFRVLRSLMLLLSSNQTKSRLMDGGYCGSLPTFFGPIGNIW